MYDSDLDLAIGSMVDEFGVDEVMKSLWMCLNDRELYDVSTHVFDALIESRVHS